MPQARGAQAQLLLQREVTFRTAPAPAAKVIPFTSFQAGRNPQRQENNTVSATPIPAKRDKGDVTPGGNFTSILDLRSIGNWLALLLGVPVANKAITQQPTLVTGVTVQYAQTATPSDAGTLAWLITGTTLTWTAFGETAGAAQNVSAGGNFLIPSSAASHGIYVTVVPASLQAGNQSDANIGVSVTLKAHTFPIDLVDRPSALLEIGHTVVAKYQRFLGSKVNKLAYDLVNNEQNISGDLIIGGEVDPIPGTVFDSAPTSYSYFRACSASGRIWDGISQIALGDIRSGSIAFDNGMTGIALAEAADGYGLIDQGDLTISGAISAVFDGAAAYDLARQNTSTRMRMLSAATIGSNTFSLVVDLLDVELEEANVPVEGKSGLWVDLNFRAHANGATRLPVITLNNDVTAF